MRGRGVGRVVAAFIVGVMTAGGTAVASAADVGSEERGDVSNVPGDVDDRVLRNQLRIGELTSWIAQHESVHGSGYVSQVNDAENLAVRLLWHGQDDLMVATLERAAGLGISATVEQWPRSLSEIEDAARRLLEAESLFADVGFEITGVQGVAADTSDIVVLGVPTDRSRSAQDVHAGSRDAAEDVAKSITGPQTRVSTVGGDIALTNGSRSEPTPPYWAGSAMQRHLPPTTDICSTGFSVLYNGSPRATTARHCDALPYTAPNGQGSFGNSLATSLDGALRVLSATGGPRMFDGPWDVGVNTGLEKGLYGLFDVGLNDYVCVSGATSGSHCNLQVTAMYVYIDDGYGMVSTISATQRTAGQIAIAGGDSGGSVFMNYVPPNDYNVSAIGMIQAGRDSVGTACGSVAYPGIECYRTVLFTSMTTALNNLSGASLLTF